jgi:transposase-like protein
MDGGRLLLDPADGLIRPRRSQGSDGSPLPGSISPGVPSVHYTRNLLGKVGAAKRKELGADLRAIFAAPNREQALRIASSVADQWRGKGHERVACPIEEHIEECLACLSFLESHRRRISTTNTLERSNQKIERRTRVGRILIESRACVS